MLCQVCASIDLKDALGVIPDSLDVPLHKKDTFTPRILHYETYALMLAAAEYCQLCALVVKNLNRLASFSGHPNLSQRRAQRTRKGGGLVSQPGETPLGHQFRERVPWSEPL